MKRPERNASPKPQVTIADVAQSAGVSIGSVSLAINGRKGVSEDTRRRVIAVAEELGWAPSSAARSLMEARTQTFGLVLARRPQELENESFFLRFITGIESELAKRSYSLLLQVVPDVNAEVEAHRRWRASRRVDGVIVVDPRRDDPRIDSLRRAGLPAVVSGDTRYSHGLANVWTDDVAAMREAVDYLVGIGHRRITRICGIPGLAHTEVRNQAFQTAIEEADIEGAILESDFTKWSGATATRRALSQRHRPTALIYDNEIMAMTGLNVAAEMGITVPSQLSIIAWDESAISDLTVPALTAVSHDVVALGACVAQLLFDVLDGADARTVLGSVPHLVVRASTAPFPSS